MNNRFFIFLIAYLAALSPHIAHAQVQVSVAVPPPYSPYVKDYIKDGTGLVVTLTNTSGSPQTVKLIGAMTGNNGVTVAMKESYMPVVPIVLGPSETKLLSQGQIKAFNSNLSEGNVQHQGFNVQAALLTGKLPEGIYQLCIRAMSYSPAAIPLGNAGCATINIMAYDPPIVMNPVDASIVKPQTPQFISFSWTPSGPGGVTKYSLRLLDLTTANLINPNDAFINEGIQPTFRQDNIPALSYSYDIGKPKLIVGHRYAVMVVASHPKGKGQYKNGGRSQVTTFTYKNTGIGNGYGGPSNFAVNDSTLQPPYGPCGTATEWKGALSTTSKDNIPNGTIIKVGHFLMKNTDFTKAVNGYTGTGEILVPFVNARIRTQFTNIRINTENRMYEGLITGSVTSTDVIDDALSGVKTGVLEKVPDMDALLGYLDDGVRAVNKMNPEKAPVDLPIHFNKNDFKIGIVGMMFEPTNAYVNALLNTPLPESVGNEYLLLGAKGIPIQPGGYGTAELKLALAKDATVALSPKAALTFKGGLNNTFAVIDCSGFRSLTLNGAWTLPRTAALPVGADNAVIADQSVQVKVPFTVQAATTMNDMLLDNLTFSHRFVVPQAQDFVIGVAGASIDLSDTKNGGAFKASYPSKGGQTDWKGVYIKSISLTLPPYLKKDGGSRITLAATHALIDKQGFSGTVSVAGDLVNGGSAAGLPFELDSVGIAFTNNQLSAGGIKGKITLPLSTAATVGVKASVSAGGTNGATVVFKMTTQTELNANLFLAKVSLGPNSTLEMKKEDGIFQATANLNGAIGIAFTTAESSNLKKLEIPKLAFEGLSIVAGEGQPTAFDIQAIELQNMNKAQGKLSDAFEINLTDIAFTKTNGGNNAGLALGMGLTLFGGEAASQNGAGVTTDFTIWAKCSGNRYVYDKAQLNAISIDAPLGVAHVKGSINIYNEDAKYGNGFRGNIVATMKALNAGISVMLQFGRTTAQSKNFKYWYFDAMVDAGQTGIPIPGTVASIYGFGGGAYCNMTPSGGPTVLKPGGFKPVAKGGDGAPTTSGVVMEPLYGEAGFKAAVLFGITGTREAFNGDLTFSMALDYNKLSVKNVLLAGSGYFMQSPENPAKRDTTKAFLWCKASIGYQPGPRILYGAFAAKLNVLKLVQGGGTMSFYFDMPDNADPANRWAIKVGEWTKSNPFEDDARLHATIGYDAKVVKYQTDFRGYFMVGNILPGLPPLPDYIYNMVKEDGVPKVKSLPPNIGEANNLAIALGAGIKFSAGFDFWVLAAEMSAEAAFDITLAKINATCDGEEAGFDGWYAQGQAYAYVRGDAKLFRRIKIAELVAGAVLQVKLPNPNWVRGDIVVYIDIAGIDAGDYHGSFERGKLCQNMQAEFKPFENLTLIKSVYPAHNATQVSPFTPVDINLTLPWSNQGVAPMQAFNAYTGKMESFDYKYTYKLKPVIGDEIACSITAMGEAFPSRKYRLYPFGPLLPGVKYRIYVTAELEGHKTESLVTEFTTGPRPESITMDAVRICYPYPGQRYAMRRNPSGGQQTGMIELKQNMAYLMEGATSVGIRFENVKTKEVRIVAVNDFNTIAFGKTLTNLTFPLPQTLEPNAIYHLSLEKYSYGNADVGTGFVKVLWDGFYFKTSKYESITEKLATYEVKKVGYTWGTQAGYAYKMFGTTKTSAHPYNNAVLFMQGGEPLDVYEMYAFNTNFVGHTEREGQMLSAKEGSSYLSAMNLQYNIHMYMSGADKDYLKTLAPGGINTTVKRRSGYPFYGASCNAFSATAPDEMFWMKNTEGYEAMMKGFKYLGPNEGIAAPEGTLSAAEIAAAKTGGGTPAFSNTFGSGGQRYYALMDYKPEIGATDKVALDEKWLALAAAKNANTLYNTFMLLQKSGHPVYPKGYHGVDMYGLDQFSGERKKLKTISYQYDPVLPKF